MKKSKDQKPTESFDITCDLNALSKELGTKYSHPTDSGKESDLIRQVESQLDKKREEVLEIIKQIPSTNK